MSKFTEIFESVMAPDSISVRGITDPSLEEDFRALISTAAELHPKLHTNLKSIVIAPTIGRGYMHAGGWYSRSQKRITISARGAEKKYERAPIGKVRDPLQGDQIRMAYGTRLADRSPREVRNRYLSVLAHELAHASLGHSSDFLFGIGNERRETEAHKLATKIYPAYKSYSFSEPLWDSRYLKTGKPRMVK